LDQFGNTFTFFINYSLKLILYVHFLTSRIYVCERSVSWKVLENAFLSPGKPLNLVFASPGKS